MKRTKILEDVLVEKIGYGGIGISTLPDGKKIIIKGGALPGNIVDCKVVRNKKDYVEVHITKIKKHNPEYLDSLDICPHFFYLENDSTTKTTNNRSTTLKSKIGCGGCKRQTISYEKQLGLKQKIIEENFKKIKEKKSDFEIKNIIGSPIQNGYRNKIEFSFGKFITKKVGYDQSNLDLNSLDSNKSDKYECISDRSLGFHKQGEFSKIVDIDHCDLIDEKINQILNYFKKVLKDSGLPVHDQMKHQGFFRHLVFRQGKNTGQVLVNLVVYEKFLIDEISQISKREKLKNLIKNDEYLQKNISTFVVTYNDSLADVVSGKNIKTEIIFGDGYIFEDLIYKKNDSEISLKFRVSPFSFFQTNTVGAQVLFSTAMDMVGETKGTILDLYCGTGSIGLSFLKAGIGDNLVGIEIVEDAIKDARHNAELNNMQKNVFFLSSPAEKIFSKDLSNLESGEIGQKIKDLSLLIVDPPRDGLHKNVIEFLIELKKKSDYKLLYISCNPLTMLRDSKLLMEGGFDFQTLQAVDMFPHTHHIECIGIFA